VAERAVLHHQHHERVDREVARAGQRCALLGGGLGHQRFGVEQQSHAGGQAGQHCRAPEELAPAQVVVVMLVGQALRDLGIAYVGQRAPAPIRITRGNVMAHRNLVRRLC